MQINANTTKKTLSLWSTIQPMIKVRQALSSSLLLFQLYQLKCRPPLEHTHMAHREEKWVLLLRSENIAATQKRCAKKTTTAFQEQEHKPLHFAVGTFTTIYYYFGRSSSLRLCWSNTLLKLFNCCCCCSFSFSPLRVCKHLLSCTGATLTLTDYQTVYRWKERKSCQCAIQ